MLAIILSKTLQWKYDKNGKEHCKKIQNKITNKICRFCEPLKGKAVITQKVAKLETRNFVVGTSVDINIFYISTDTWLML